MAVFLYDINDAVDHKYVITKSLSGQAKAGTLVHVMGCSQAPSSSVSVDYRITETGQDFHINFPDLNHFCKWARPDAFVIRHYDKLDRKDVLKYINVRKRTLVSLCLPCIIILMFVIWIAALNVIPGNNILIGVLLSLCALVFVFFVYRVRRKIVVDSVYKKIFKAWKVILK